MILLPLALAADPEPPAWVPAGADVRVFLAEEEPRIVLEYRFRQVRPGWAELPLVGPGLVPLQGADPAAVLNGPGGLFVVLPPDRTTATVRIEALLPERQGASDLRLLPSPGARVWIDAPGLDVSSTATGGLLPSTGALALSWRPAVARAPVVAAPVVLGESSVAAWESEGALAVRARVRWKVLRGERSLFRLDVAGLDEVEVTGANVARWERRGDVVEITPRAVVRGLWSVDVTGRRALPTGEAVVVPRVGPADALRVDRWVTLGRAEEREVLPETVARGMSPRALPVWARGLSDSPAVATFGGEAPVSVRAVKFEPMMGPDTVVERADFVLATSAEGRTLLRSTWLVRNERRQYLRVSPVDGFRPLTARVSGTPLTVLSDGAGGILVPLEKSVETMLGLVSFPVEVTWIADGPAWEEKGERAFALPSVDAPIQATRWEVHLPRDVEPEDGAGRRSRGVPGGVVGGVAGGVFGGVAYGAAAPASGEVANEAGQAAWLNALEAYKDNDFEATQEWLDVARQQAPTDENVSRLQSNLDVLVGSDDAAEDVQARRVRDLANAKTVTQQVEQAEVEKKAEEALRSGDTEAAEVYLEQSVALAERIAVTEQKESQEYASKMKSSADKLSSLRKQAKQDLEVREVTRDGAVAEAEEDVPPPPPPEPPPEPVQEAIVDALDAESYVVDGEEVSDIGGVLSGMLDTEFMAQVPTGRSYQSAVEMVPGVAGRGRGGKGTAEPPRPAPTSSATSTSTATVTTEADVTRAAQSMPATVSRQSLDRAPVTVEAPRREARDRRDTNPDAGVGASAAFGPEAPLADAPSAAPSTTAAPGLKPAAPARAALRVQASPLTPALPLDGPTVAHADALLPAGAHPRFTVRYRTRGPR